MTDVKFKFRNIDFEWDSEKAALNKIKHGISFEVAAQIFDDEDRVEVFDEIHSVYEDRWIVIGKVGEVLFVVYTERVDAIRLISAREATANERRYYYAHKENH